MSARVKRELAADDTAGIAAAAAAPAAGDLIDLGSSSESDSSDENSAKRPRQLPAGFLDPLPQPGTPSALPTKPTGTAVIGGSKQFWKAGDYGGGHVVGAVERPVGALDHVRVHPKFLHSNATSHKWALGALAELLDNSIDEVSNGATYVNIDMLVNRKDGTRMLLIEDDGGGMNPDKLRQCMSLGYSAKSKMASTIGQYGNGFKTSTMRLGADVIVFSRSSGKEGSRDTQSIGLLSYTFLRNTGKEDIVVPMLDYEKEQQEWKRIRRTMLSDWNTNLETIVKWSPFRDENELLEQFCSIKDQGTRIIIYNLWEDDQGELELDFDADNHDIQIRGVNRDEKNILMAMQFPNSKHFLTYRHSLRSYASILYLRLPHTFRMILRDKEIEHHNIVTDMMLKQEVTYRPQTVEGINKDPNMVAVVTIGFVKDAKHHIDVQGFNVYHQNRLIKPFWRVWTAAGSGGRGVIGVLEANFIEPAHDKQDFERTTILSRLEARLVQMQKNYWFSNSQRIGYAGSRNNRSVDAGCRESSPEAAPHPISNSPSIGRSTLSYKSGEFNTSTLGPLKVKAGKNRKYSSRGVTAASKRARTSIPSLAEASDDDLDLASNSSVRKRSLSSLTSMPSQRMLQKRGASLTPDKGTQCDSSTGALGAERMSTRSSRLKGSDFASLEVVNPDSEARLVLLNEENRDLKERITKLEEELSQERDQIKSLSEKLKKAEEQLTAANREQDSLIDLFSDERQRREKEEESLRKKLKDASATIQDLMEKLKAI